jgi:hypothetical protein
MDDFTQQPIPLTRIVLYLALLALVVALILGLRDSALIRP